MAIKDFFKADPGPERERTLNDPEQILAWLEELARIGTLLDLGFNEADLLPVQGRANLVGEETRTCTFILQYPPRREPDPGQRVHLAFPMDGQRFQTDLTYQGRGGYLEYRFSLPTAIRHAERRSSTRVRLRSRDQMHVVALQGLFAGLGLSGALLDLSMTGCRFLLHRAIRVQDERRMTIHPNLLPDGTPLALVRLPDLTHLPIVECGGRVSHVRRMSRGVAMGIAFENLGSFETGILGKFISERIPGFHMGFPWKRRYKDLTEGERAVAQPCTDTQTAQEPGESSGTPPELLEAIHDGGTLNKLRKRGKKILFIMSEDLTRTILMTLFHQDGYRCLFEASSLIMALELHRRLPLDLLVVDQTVGSLGALRVIKSMRAQGLSMSTPVVVIQGEPDPHLTFAVKVGKISLLVDRPVDFPGKLQEPLEKLLNL